MLEILNILYVVVVVLLLFGAAIFVHEFGHFWVALKRGLVVEEFAIGFGPIIWSREKDGILYTIRCIPAGGFVKLPQMLTSEAIEGKADGKEEGEDGGEDSDEVPAEPLPQISPLSKILVAFAGPIMNVIFAIVIAILLWIVGLPKEASDPVVGYVGKNSKEYELGVRPGDKFFSINGKKVEDLSEVTYAVLGSAKKGVPEGVVVAVMKRGKWDVNETTGELAVEWGDPMPPIKLPAAAWGRVGYYRLNFVEFKQSCEILSVAEPSLLASVGFEPGDIIEDINGDTVHGHLHLINLLMANVEEEKIISVMRNTNRIQLTFSTPNQAGVKVGAVPEPTHGTWAKFRRKFGKKLEPLEATPAMKAKIKQNDLIQAINGQRIISVTHLTDLVRANDDKELELDIIRDGKEKKVYATPKDRLLGILLQQDHGLLFKPEPSKYIVQQPGPTPWAQVADVLGKIAITFRALGSRKESGVGVKDLSGPVGIFGMLSIMANTDLRLALSFLVLLNINLAILNLLPVPVLDGGHILLSLIEWVRKKPVSVRLQEYATTAFAAVLLCFFLYVTMHDVKRVPLLHHLFNRDTQVEAGK